MDICGNYINVHFVTDIYMTYEKWKDYFTMNLGIERWMLFLDIWLRVWRFANVPLKTDVKVSQVKK